ncbi:MAG: hypothetical protein IKH70_06085, partial [Stomatobaculum sp.]|nr:hypothetical protein [Stomatobaculum sp.]
YRVIAAALAAAAVLVTLLAQTVLAGDWKWNREKGKWWYLDDQNTYPVNGWEWIDGKCYRFDEEGYLYVDTVTPEGLTVNANGEWTVNGVVQEMETVLKENPPKQETVVVETAAETQPAATEPETKAAETTAAETLPAVETEPETKPAETTAAETLPAAETTAAETQPAETTAAETQPAETAAEKPAVREENGRLVTPWFSCDLPEIWKGRYACRIWDDNAVALCSKANLDHGGTLFTVIASETYRETDSFPDYGEIRYLGYIRNDETGKEYYLYYAGITDVPYDHLDPLKMVEYSAMQVTEPEVLQSILGPHGETLHFQGKAY